MKVLLWDTPSGSTTASAFVPLFYREAMGAIIVTNSTNARSITEACVWKRQLDDHTAVNDRRIPTILMINNSEAEDDEEPSPKELEDIKTKMDVDNVSCVSAMSSAGVEPAFKELLHEILR